MKGFFFGCALFGSLGAAMLASLGLTFLVLKWLNESTLGEWAVGFGQLGAIAAGIAMAVVSAKAVIEGFQRAYNRR